VAASRRDNGVPTTSYAVLGMLAIRPWSAYELNKQLRRSLAYCWPKTQSVLYDEPKRLAALGWARSRSEPAGRRTRTVYEITPAGQEALREWLATEPAAPRFEIEPMLRLLFADQGTKEDALAAVRSMAEWAAAQGRAGLQQSEEYLADGGPFPQRLHIIAPFALLVASLCETLIAWSDQVSRDIEDWPGTKDVGMTSTARKQIEQVRDIAVRNLER
jgi:PadR family transcriptional regulator, regulatory protein AphA